MHWSARLLPLLWALACSFPDFKVQEGLGDGAGSSGASNGGTATVVPSCKDGALNGDETGPDCGFAACNKGCEVNQGCDANRDCAVGACKDQICQPPTCGDELLNGSESDVDCGGDSGCQRCAVNQRCKTLADCDGGLCTNGLCRDVTCKDGLQNGNETDVDCGGPDCAACDEGKSCLVSTDCDNVACEKGKCQPKGCSDELKNSDETDVDCGGSCPSPCADELRCKVAADCESGVCNKQTLRCSAPACNDGVQNGTEPTLDCGVSCTTKCQLLDRCTIGPDCASTSCVSEECLPAAPSNEAYLMSGWVATASHELMTNGPAPKAIDGSLSSNWISGTDQFAGMWFEVDMLERRVVYSLELVIDDASTEDFPQKLDVWLSDDGTFTNAVVKNKAGAAVTRIDFATPQVARYIKLSLSADVSKTKWWRIDELYVRQ